jgi:hypothetical protein
MNIEDMNGADGSKLCSIYLSLACNCVLNNTLYHNSSVCNATSGQCVCKSYVGGLQCERCADNYYNTSHGCRRKHHILCCLY